MLKLLVKIFLSSGSVLGTFAVTGNLPFQKSWKVALISNSESNSGTSESGTISSIKDIAIFEKKNNCSFSFAHRWGEQEVYSIDQFLEKNKSNESAKEYTRKAITKANEFKDKCKEHGVIVLFYYGEDFNLTGTVSSG